MSGPVRRKHSSGMPNFRAWLDYFMAGLMVLGGLFIMFSEKMIGYDYFADSDFVQGWMKWLLGIVFILYGAFRAYRGYQLQQLKKWEEEG